MPHAIWTGSISFGLVTIPVKLMTAVREDEGVHFHLLHAKDEGRIHNTRTCEHCHKDVPWNDVVRGYEYEKGKYVVVTDDELKEYRPESTQAIDIVEFVDATEIDAMLFDKPYYVEPEKKGKHAYALLREALKKSGKVGIAKVVLRTREYLAAVKPSGNALVLEMMHFAHEIVSPSEIDLPPAKEKTPEGEMKAAMMLIDAMAKKFDPAEFHDEYQEKLKAMLEDRAKGAPAPKAPKKQAARSNVIDLMDVLQKSLAASKSKRAGSTSSKSRRGGSSKARTSSHSHAHARSRAGTAARKKAS